MIDLKYEFDNIIEKYGHPVIVLHKQKNKRCNCVDLLTRSPNKECPVCLGMGFINSAEVTKIRMVSKYSLENFKFPEIGKTTISQANIFLKSEVRPQKDDLVIQCEFVNGKPVIDEYSGIYLIDNVAPLRADGGQIVYFNASVESQVINQDKKLENFINNWNKKDSSEIYTFTFVDAGRYVLDSTFTNLYDVAPDAQDESDITIKPYLALDRL
jgi:hypothetical protein